MLNGMVAGLESRLGALLEDKFWQFASRIEDKLSVLSHKVEQMDGRVHVSFTGASKVHPPSGDKQSPGISCGVRKSHGPGAHPAYTVKAHLCHHRCHCRHCGGNHCDLRRTLQSHKNMITMECKGQTSWASLVGPFRIKIGQLTSQKSMYVANIADDMFLGVDYLDKHDSIIDLENHTLMVHGVRLPL
ncbi:hypothetical protein PoB_005675000 [Plakobranchus ocellatus]|uniref:Uncharacterized protein n=1 Tax=Plakobranchus ocellatus TaxID=259542 RepID=A0AAV4CEV5_9GAST|nr:hypothetical protein PoB_005675000 [Plakobranchus ocellatus]